jgi:hypothetical protein
MAPNMKSRGWQVGVVGTFDVENYGDLLFPLLAEAELTERLGAVELHRFSYHAKSPPGWAYPVLSVAELPERAGRLDALLVGGGFLIRFDKEVAPGYRPPGPAVHHPTGYWLTPALIAGQHGIPLVWNAPGMHCNEVPAWAEPLLELAFAHSRYIAVRDEPTRAALARFAGDDRITVVPDTGFGIARLVDRRPSGELDLLRTQCGLTGKYLVVQAAHGLEPFLRFAARHADRLRDFQVLALPVGPVLGDYPSILEAELPGVVRLPAWPHPLLLAELISRAEAVVGHSYHLAITALTAGVPVFTPQNLATGKYSALADFRTIHPLPGEHEPDPARFLARVGKAAPAAAVRDLLGPLDRHWDRVAAAVEAGPAPLQPALGRFWQSLPGLLEDAACRQAGEAAALRRLLALARGELALRDQQVAALHDSTSWKLTSPLRSCGSWLRGNNGRRNLINWSRITEHRLETEPYRWAMIGDLFSPGDAVDLAKTYPRDHFKRLSARGGEKDYEYEARSLIGMGAETASYPEELSPAWRSLAADLVSPAYRNAMSLLTDCDLTAAPLEVNVFHYGPGASLGPHPDLSDKIVTHVLYFNQAWDRGDGGCLSILRSADAADIAAEVPPLVGNSAVIVRSEASWHAVAPVVRHSPVSRRSVTVTFYRPGAVSSMWPPGDPTPLHRYEEAGPEPEPGRPHPGPRWWQRLVSQRR